MVRLEGTSMEEPILMNSKKFGMTLSVYRQRKGISQSGLADLCDFDHSYISRLEGGHRLPTRQSVRKIASALDLVGDDYSKLLASAGFLPDESGVVARQVLSDIDLLLNHPNQSAYASKIALDQLNTIVWWLKLGARIEDKVVPQYLVEEKVPTATSEITYLVPENKK